MNSIIRSNAIETSSQTENGMNFHNLYPDCDLVSKKAFIYGDNVALTKSSLLKASTNTNIAKVTNLRRFSKKTNYWSTPLQALLDQLPLTLAHLVTLRSIVFFTAVVVSGWTGKIEQVSHVRGKFVALEEPQKLERQHLGKIVKTAVEEAQELKTGHFVAELDRELSSEVEGQQHLAAEQMQFNHIKDLMTRTRMLAQTRVSLRAEEKAGLAALSTLEPQNAEILPVSTESLKQRHQQLAGITHILDGSVKQNFSISSNRARYIFTTAKPLKKLGQKYQVKVALAGDNLTNTRKIIKLKAPQTATAK